MLSSREIAKSAKSLICLLQSLVGQQVQIELRNDTYILGTLGSVDAQMNTELTCAHIWSIYADLHKRIEESNPNEPIEIDTEPNSELLLAQPQVDYLFIKGCRIRYFYLPKDADITDCIEQQIATFMRRKAPTERAFNWKSYRKKQKLEELQQKVAEMEGTNEQSQERTQQSEPTTS